MSKRALFLIGLLWALLCEAETTLDASAPYAFGANIGWVNGWADGTNGAVVGQAFCWGNFYSANCGWINLGDGSPMNGSAYSNEAGDFGVNHNGQGQLTGFAYGASIGWIQFEQTHGQPEIDLLTGELSGYAYGANVGWIRLATMEVAQIDSGPDTDGDGIPDAWEYQRYGQLNWLGLTPRHDRDDDGVSDRDEYLADTDPVNGNDQLLITAFKTDNDTNSVTWNARSTRVYMLEHAVELDGNWAAASAAFVPAASQKMTATVDGTSNRYYRVTVDLPLSD